jgi:hypothetical protein
VTVLKSSLDAGVGRAVQRDAGWRVRLARFADFGLKPPGQQAVGGSIDAESFKACSKWSIECGGLKPLTASDRHDDRLPLAFARAKR